MAKRISFMTRFRHRLATIPPIVLVLVGLSLVLVYLHQSSGESGISPPPDELTCSSGMIDPACGSNLSPTFGE